MHGAWGGTSGAYFGNSKRQFAARSAEPGHWLVSGRRARELVAGLVGEAGGPVGGSIVGSKDGMVSLSNVGPVTRRCWVPVEAMTDKP